MLDNYMLDWPLQCTGDSFELKKTSDLTGIHTSEDTAGPPRQMGEHMLPKIPTEKISQRP